MYGKSRQVFCVCCFQFPAPGRGPGTQLGLLQALPPLGQPCLLRDLTAGKFQRGREEPRLGARAASSKLQQELKNKTKPKAQAAGAGEERADIRDSHRESAPKALCKSKVEKPGFAEHTGGTAEPEQVPATQICAAHQCTATNSTQNKGVNPHYHL